MVILWIYLRSEAAKLWNRVIEWLTGEYPKVSSVKGKEVSINRGSSSGIHKGDLYCVYEKNYMTFDKDGKTVGWDTVDLAIIEIISVKKDIKHCCSYEECRR